MTNLTNAALDLLFEPRGGTTKRADVGLQTLGVDISNRYMQPSQGGTATAASTGIHSGGADISTLLTEIGTNAAVLAISSSNVSGVCTFFGGNTGCQATSAVAAGTASGGSGSYTTYLWEYVSGTVYSIVTPNSATTQFSDTAPSTQLFTSGVYRITVTDSLSATANTTITVQLNHNNLV